MSDGFQLHPEAYNDLDDLWEFIAEDSIDAADRVRDNIYDAIQALVPFPHQGHRRTDLSSRPLRFRRVYDYLIAYAPDERPCGLWLSCTATAARV
jgi:plasmid stabilization system protein ParE